MLNQYYKYLSGLILDFFKEIEIKSGDRFYLQLDTLEEINNLVDALEDNPEVNVFTYTHDKGEPYLTFSIKIGEVNVVFAHTSLDVTPDFLVTLRNQVGEQKEEWRDTALFSIVSEQLDSIEGGSSNLQKEGMPLHPNSLFKKLKEDIEDSRLSKTEKIILTDNLKRLMDDHYLQQVNLLDFEEIFEVLIKGKIEDCDYKKFGLFKDLELASIQGNKNKVFERIERNRELFEYVQNVHDFGKLDDDLDRRFVSKGAHELKKDDWTDIPFAKVAVYAEEKEKENKSTKVELTKISIDPSLTMWDKALSDTTAGKRKRQIIVFNPNSEPTITIKTNYEIEGSQVKSLSRDYFSYSKGSDLIINVGRVNASFEIMTNEDEPTFTKITYKHEGKSSLGSEFHIAIFPCNEFLLKDLKTKYFVNVREKCIELESDITEIKFGDGYDTDSIEVISADEVIQVPDDTEVTVLPQQEAFDDNDQLMFYVEEKGCKIPILLKNDLPEATPINGMRIWKMKREEAQDFKLENNRLLIGNSEFYTHKEYKSFFEWETTWVNKNIQFAILDSEEILPKTLDLDGDLREAYSRFMQYFRTHSIPSLCYYSDELKHRAKEYLSEYIKQIKSFEEGKAPGSKGRNLMKLGMMKASKELFFTPFHPLVVAYQLMISEQLGKEVLDNTIMNRLKPDSLIPFIYSENDQLYKPDSQSEALEWIRFKPVQEVTVSNASHYLAKVVLEKIDQFEEHFKYLFMRESKAPLQINVINITNDKEVLRGIVNWIINKINESGPEELKAVEVSLYMNEGQLSAFDIFSRMESIDQIKSFLKINNFKSSKYDESDVLRLIRENLFYFKHNINTKEYRYGHITFYKMQAQQQHAHQPMEDMITGLSLDGIVSTVPSMKGEENYRSGFGIKGCNIREDNLLLETSIYTNELAANMRNDGNDTYKRGESIVSRTDTDDEETLSRIFDSSYWVTFIDPNVDLEFFQKYDRNLVVIHYNDQFTSSSRYDAITVTDKSDQFNAVIKEILKEKEIEISDENVNSTIKAFNTFNGEWLLRIIGGKGHFDREKLSIISAIKYSLAYFNHQNILWVPISLEEILRVAGAVSLNKREGIFTAKNLGVIGKHSDDLLLVGLEYGEKLKLHFYPVEVKIGINSTNVYDRAKEQIMNTRKLLDEELSFKEIDGKPAFRNLFYRNFFSQIFIANAKKIAQSELWPECDYHLTDDVVEKLLSDVYEVSTELKGLIGNGAILSFKKDAYLRSSSLEDNVMIINLTLNDGFNGIVESIQQLTDRIQSGRSDFVKERLISYNYKYKRPEKLEELQETVGPVEIEEQGIMKEESSVKTEPNSKVETTENTTKVNNESDGKKEVNLEDIRILIGKALNSNREIYWEYGNKELSNRHLLISGTSGQGKTYFMQCLLLEKAKKGISSIVIDYTEGFLPNQLEPEFVEFLGTNLKQSIVYNEGFPINPFKKNEREIGGLKLPESVTDVAERIKSVFGAVYSSLGIQQLNSIYEATINGLQKYGDSMDLQKLKIELETDTSSNAKTALSQIRPLIDRNPFTSNAELDWKEIINSDGQVFVVQLTGYPRDVQLMITEFILWDLWNFSIRNGSKYIPMPVLMDEAQNLDHTENSPSARILQEGRKFGWSAWCATQFLKSQLDASELARLQMSSEKVYFLPPTQLEISYIAGSLSQEPSEKREWESKLASLKKGQCIVHGPVLNERDELTKPIVTIVDITPLHERINNI
ncbi:DNA phosphorothioation-dependent restriction protein DptH [Bacillus salitolerans]|uniref:DNA phosphorothioation-dependent restriction protein DptH n=1 Tax=Bacillus salitolerans TaxID=1437434 RepID=A0ABW4LXH9_9BACI